MLTTEFFVTSLIVILIPGTGVMYTVSTGLVCGGRASIDAAAGCTAGIVPHLLACIAGLSVALHLSALAFQLIRYAGCCYLFYLAWSMWRQHGTLAFSRPMDGKDLAKIISRGFLINILNPKLSLFFLAFLPLFISPESGPPTLQLITLAGVFMAMTFGVFVLYGLLANSVRRYLVNGPARLRYLQRSFAAAFALLGLKLAISER